MIINKNNIIRLSKYKKALNRLKAMGFKKVFSDNLADAIGVDPSQVRKDFSLFDISGNKKGGYYIDELIEMLNKILGKDDIVKVIIAGAGNVGKALMNYKGFEKEGIKIVAAFDTDQTKIGSKIDIPVLPLEGISEYIKKNKIKIGIIATPEMFAQHVLDTMILAGIKGALNFAPIHLRTPEDFVISNVNFELELETIIYFVNFFENNNKSEKSI
jgi:redox-sensing transcriptional repressor